MWGERSIPRLIIVTPLVSIAMLTAIITYYYVEQMQSSLKQQAKRLREDFITGKKLESERLGSKLIHLFAHEENSLEDEIKKETKERVGSAYEMAVHLHDKYADRVSKAFVKNLIKDAVSRIAWEGERGHVWITDYDGNSVYSNNKAFQGANIADYEDADGRAIVLEEIQKVRKHGQGFLKSRIQKGKSEQILYVKDFGHYRWFFGGGNYIVDARSALKNRILDHLRSVPLNGSGFFAIFDNGGPLYLSAAAKAYLGDDVQKELQIILKTGKGQHYIEWPNAIINVKYFEPFGWYVLHGFDIKQINAMIDAQYLELKEAVEKEVWPVVAIAVVVGLFAMMVSLLFSRRINVIVSYYKERAEEQEASLRDFDRLLEARVKQEVSARREEEKILVQQSKMAAMGDVISMIAHQWRQPLNQMSHVFMNIEGAHEYNELSKEYLDKKLKEGTELLEFMSHTIDDFRNYFIPDKEREEVCVAEVVDHSAALIVKSLEAHGIELETVHHSYSEIKIYRNELMQVLLNLLKNAKDVLTERLIEAPKITITTKEDELDMLIEVCDNGGGIDTAIKEKIFEPYFTTKERNSVVGLGLYMSQSILRERLHGTLSVENTDEGACFMLRMAKNQTV